MVRRRHYGGNAPAESLTQSLYPDYERLFKLVAAPPTVSYTPFDENIVLVEDDGRSVRLSTLRETLASSTTRDPRVQFVAYEQTYPDPPAVSYPAPPEKPAVALLPEPQLPQPPVLADFLPAPTELGKRVPLLYAVQRVLAGPSTTRKWQAAIAKHNREYPAVETEQIRIRKQNELAQTQLQTYESARSKWESLNKQFRTVNAETSTTWETAKRQFASLKATDIARLEMLKKAYLERDRDAIVFCTKLVLKRSPYPAIFPKNIDAAYDADSRIIVVDYQLPDIEGISIVKPSTKKGDWNRFVPASATECRQVSDDLFYMIMLRTLREIVLADEIEAFSAAAVNGWMSFKDKATGQQRSEYLMSLYAKANQVRAIDFANVDPKTCFQSLKGISAPRPTQCVPIAPILKFDKSDRRIISSREVIDQLAAESNLAAMPWEDFEHLIRELFEKEFSHDGAEVRVTQASHDRGVDALVFDPDPVRGGKYVIQAKRYTMTVDVSSVRDLYGTVLNEGANRGILVTTSTYGPDAYDFAKDKPITLIDGSRLLHLLQKHGYNFRIDIREAKRLLADQPDSASQ